MSPVMGKPVSLLVFKIWPDDQRRRAAGVFEQSDLRLC